MCFFFKCVPAEHMQRKNYSEWLDFCYRNELISCGNETLAFQQIFSACTWNKNKYCTIDDWLNDDWEDQRSAKYYRLRRGTLAEMMILNNKL